jgi:RHS repeat-associated protein
VYQYDALGQVVSGQKHWSDGTLVAGQQFSYGFDSIGNRQSSGRGGDVMGIGLRQSYYSANLLNQYTRRTVPGAVDVIGTANANATVTANNQRAYRRDDYYWAQAGLSNGAAAVWASVTNIAVLNNGANPDIVATNMGNVFLAQTPEVYGYDLDGNLTNDGRWSYTWDAENRLTGMTSLAGAPAGSKLQLGFTYDYKGRRVQKTVSSWNGTNYIGEYTDSYAYDGWNCIAVLSPSQGVVSTFMWGLDLSGSAQGAGGVGGLLAANLGSNGVNFVAYDGNGNVAALVNAGDQTDAAKYEYGPFGEVIRQSGPMAKLNPFRFSTKYCDDESDLVYYGWRYYNPSTGRWPNRDPYDEIGSETLFEAQEFEGLNWEPNLYTAMRNDAVDFTDSDGRFVPVVVAGAVCVDVGVTLLVNGTLTYVIVQACTSKCCPPCKPPVGTIAYRWDKVPPSKPHWPHKGDHVHLYERQQNPNNCICFWKPIGVTAPPPPPGAIPMP